LKLDSLIDIYEKNLKHTRGEKQQVTAILDSLFSFNPNTVSFEQMILLGFDSIIARRNKKGFTKDL
jgi:hypothetical protein